MARRCRICMCDDIPEEKKCPLKNRCTRLPQPCDNCCYYKG